MKQDVLSSWITVDGVTLPEYEYEASDIDRRYTYWVPSESGKEFVVNVQRTSSEFSTSTRIFIDGKRAMAEILFAGGEFDTVSCSAVTTSNTTERPLMFAELQFTDDDDSLLVHSESEGLGEIRIEQWRIEATMEMAFGAEEFVGDNRPVHERLAKASAVSHRAVLGDERTRQNQLPVWSTRPIGRLVTIVYRYRPLAILQARGIAPLSPVRESTPPEGHPVTSWTPSSPESSTLSSSHRAGIVNPKPEFIIISSDEEDERDDGTSEDAISALQEKLRIARMEARLIELKRKQRSKQSRTAKKSKSYIT
ncbi:hypothetical protein CYLTODRAFT_419936 [Cylindrobasidium torrendii FP15055 ss-10]|uniref:DUF7918 domain-containing protein n=1 Tax=Cylindrobasidium torrendii FP15055 ss-10 TaxID=1314674 RepID=A0A0D7BID3_9AGAR|nr:hypothetical protein CYLTODRAFT_419936 [Cylindrobasidium torrendii FP15055 ss-10]